METETIEFERCDEMSETELEEEHIELLEAMIENTDDTSSSSSAISSTSSSSSSEEEVENGNSLPRTTENFMLTIDSFTGAAFKKHFRLEKITVNRIIDMYTNARVAPRHNHGGRVKMGTQKEIYIYLWYIGNTVTFRQLGVLFGISKSSAWNVIVRVSSWLVSISKDYIKWPAGEEITNSARIFESKKGIPGVIGAIDGTHFRIKRPQENHTLYYNRKKYYSVAMQAVVDAKKRFIDIHCGEPGSLHDGRILRRSHLFVQSTESQSRLFPNDTHLLGDSAYPLKKWLITPFKDDGSLTPQKTDFNHIHSSTRILVENAFGLLKGKFRRLLHFTECMNLNLCVNIIVSACVLHNMSVNEGDVETEIESETEAEMQDLQQNARETEIQENLEENTRGDDGTKRQQIINYLIEKRLLRTD